MEVTVENASLDIKQRIDLIKQVLLINEIQLNSISDEDEYFHKFEIIYNNRPFILNLYLKNVVNSGWSDKPFIKRIQVPSFLGKTIPANSKNSISLFLGIAFVCDEPVFVVWNPFSFVYHKTNRSCYVTVQTLAETYQAGLLKTIDSKKEIVGCDKNNFKRLLDICCE